jgi:hypothetical protein
MGYGRFKQKIFSTSEPFVGGRPTFDFSLFSPFRASSENRVDPATKSMYSTPSDYCKGIVSFRMSISETDTRVRPAPALLGLKALKLDAG